MLLSMKNGLRVYESIEIGSKMLNHLEEVFKVVRAAETVLSVFNKGN